MTDVSHMWSIYDETTGATEAVSGTRNHEVLTRSQSGGI